MPGRLGRNDRRPKVTIPEGESFYCSIGLPSCRKNVIRTEHKTEHKTEHENAVFATVIFLLFETGFRWRCGLSQKDQV